MKDLLVIIPVHKIDDEVKLLLSRAISSVPEEIKVVISTNLENVRIEDFDSTGRVELIHSTEGNFQSLVNHAVKVCENDYKWFSILEFDDEYTPIWFDNFKKYVEFNPEVSVFLPMVDLIDYNNNQYIGFGNEAPWASSFSNEIGYIDNESLQNYFDFHLTGSIFNIKDWEEMGGLKASMKLTFWYELMLRWTNKGKHFFVIPKLGYKHYVNRPTSLYKIYSEELSEEESIWWYETARQESFHKKDRNKVYNGGEKGE